MFELLFQRLAHISVQRQSAGTRRPPETLAGRT